jgi:hypothetical protein
VWQQHTKEETQGLLKKKHITSAQAFGRTRRPMRPASLALKTFSNSGMMVEFELETKV